MKPLPKLLALLLIVASQALFLSQTPAGVRPSFEVASIKPVAGTNTRRFMTSDESQFPATGYPVKNLVAYAYRVRDYQVIGASGWMREYGNQRATNAQPQCRIRLRPNRAETHLSCLVAAPPR